MRDMTLILLLVLAVAASSFAGSALALYAVRQQEAADMVALRGQVEPDLCRLFATGGQQP